MSLPLRHPNALSEVGYIIQYNKNSSKSNNKIVDAACELRFKGRVQFSLLVLLGPLMFLKASFLSEKQLH
jgi:hypothetical protein